MNPVGTHPQADLSPGGVSLLSGATIVDTGTRACHVVVVARAARSWRRKRITAGKRRTVTRSVWAAAAGRAGGPSIWTSGPQGNSRRWTGVSQTLAKLGSLEAYVRFSLLFRSY